MTPDINDYGEDIKKIVWSYVKRFPDYVKCFDSLEDMHSEIMMWCVRRFPQWNPERGALTTYLYYVCKACTTYNYQKWKRHHNKLIITSLDDQLNGSDNTYLDLLEAEVVDPLEAETLREKKKEQNYILNKLRPYFSKELTYSLNGMSYRKIAKLEGISAERVRQKVATNKRLLKKMLERLKNGNLDKFTYQEAFRKIKIRLGCAERTAYRILNRYVDYGKVTLGVEDILNNLISKEDNYGKRRDLRKRNS